MGAQYRNYNIKKLLSFTGCLPRMSWRPTPSRRPSSPPCTAWSRVNRPSSWPSSRVCWTNTSQPTWNSPLRYSRPAPPWLIHWLLITLSSLPQASQHPYLSWLTLRMSRIIKVSEYRLVFHPDPLPGFHLFIHLYFSFTFIYIIYFYSFIYIFINILWVMNSMIPV